MYVCSSHARLAETVNARNYFEVVLSAIAKTTAIGYHKLTRRKNKYAPKAQINVLLFVFLVPFKPELRDLPHVK